MAAATATATVTATAAATIITTTCTIAINNTTNKMMVIKMPLIAKIIGNRLHPR